MTRRPARGADSSSPAEADTSGGSDGTPPGLTLDVQTAETESSVLVNLTGALDVETSGRFVAALSGTFSKHPDVEIDLGRITFLDVAGARALVEIRDQVLASGGRLRVAGLDEQRLPTARVLDLRRHLADGAPGSVQNV